MKTYEFLVLTAIMVATTATAEPDRIAEFKAAIAQDQQALTERRAAYDKQIATLEEELAVTARQLIQQQLATTNAEEETQEAAKTVNTAQSQANTLSEALRLIEGAADRAKNHADVLLSELPGKSDTRNQLANASPSTVLDTLVTEHHAALEARVVKTQIHRPDGTPGDAELLAVSNAHFAYRLPDGSGAIALDSPNDASGYRWSEALDPAQATALDAAMEAVKLGKPTAVPMDVTATLQVASWRTATSWADRIKAGGTLMYPLALVALIAALLILERLFVWNRERGRAAVITTALQACREHRIADAIDELTQRGRGVASRILLAALERNSGGQDAMEDGIEVQLLSEAPKLRRRLSGIAVLGAVAPLLGLLGTVTGIIETFAVIKGSGTTDAGLMAGGISQALVTTAAGLVIAIPILLLHRVIAGAMDRIISEAEFHAATVLTILSRSDNDADHPTS